MGASVGFEPRSEYNDQTMIVASGLPVNDAHGNAPRAGAA
jgi:hypothetical protein